jgi:hypothetical protein
MNDAEGVNEVAMRRPLETLTKTVAAAFAFPSGYWSSSTGDAIFTMPRASESAQKSRPLTSRFEGWPDCEGPE